MEERLLTVSGREIGWLLHKRLSFAVIMSSSIKSSCICSQVLKKNPKLSCLVLKLLGFFVKVLLDKLLVARCWMISCDTYDSLSSERARATNWGHGVQNMWCLTAVVMHIHSLMLENI